MKLSLKTTLVFWKNKSETIVCKAKTFGATNHMMMRKVAKESKKDQNLGLGFTILTQMSSDTIPFSWSGKIASLKTSKSSSGLIDILTNLQTLSLSS